MTSLLAILPLLVPVQTATDAPAGPQAVDYLPADTFLAFEISAEPWQRLGDRTIVAQLMQQEPMAEMMTPMMAQIDEGLAMASAQMGFDLGALLTGSRLTIAVPFDTLTNEGGQIVLGADLPAAIAEGADLGKMLNSFGQGAWWQEGTVLLGTLHTDEMESAEGRIGEGFETGVFQPSPWREADLGYLNSLVDAGRKGAGLTGQETFQRMASKARTGNDLMAIWVVFDQFTFNWIEQMSGEAMPPGIQELADASGVSKLDGFGYSFSVQPPMLEDRMVLAGPGFGAEMFPADLLELVNLPQLLAALPHDAMQVQLSALDYDALSSMLQSLLDFALSIEGEELPPEAEPILDAVWRGLGSVGPVSASVMRLADFDAGNAGEVWLQVRDADTLNEVLGLIPQEVYEGVEQAMAMNPAAPKLKFQVEGNRFVIMDSLGQPSTERLVTQAEFQPSADWLQQFPAGQVFGIEFIHRDLIVEGFSMMRSRGDDLLGMMGGDVPISFEVLPEPVVMRAILRPMTGVWMAHEDGISSITRSPLGAMPTRLLVAMPTMMNLFESFGMGIADSLDEDEF